MISPKILLLFIGLPLLELWLLIEVGSEIGGFTTIVLTIFTAVLGVQLVRMQGFSALQRVQVQMQQGEVPAESMFEGVALLIAGVLLLVPGFLTDTLGFLLLVPPLRQRMIASVLANARVDTQAGSAQGPYRDAGPAAGHRHTLNGEFTREDD